MKINITGLDKVDVLLALYDHAKTSPKKCTLQRYSLLGSKYVTSISPGNSVGCREQAVQALETFKDKLYFEKLELGGGIRVLKIHLDGDEIDITLYDKENGIGRGKEAIASVYDKLALCHLVNAFG